ncbi:MAG TPA: type II toxin-antitoxin system RelE/ParE family toxin [Steroidobacteraceae bacterium]
MKSFPAPVKHALGIELMRVQAGVDPVDFKPIQTVGRGAYEIRVHLQGAWRVIYVARLKGTVYVLHAFQKKTQKTARIDIERASKRYKLIGD